LFSCLLDNASSKQREERVGGIHPALLCQPEVVGTMPAKDFAVIVCSFTASREGSLTRGLQFAIVDANGGVCNSARTDSQIDISLEPFLNALTELVRIFDAIGSQFVAEFIRKDVLCKLAIVRAAAVRHDGVDTVRSLFNAETLNPPTGFFRPTPAIPALQWLTRVLHFIEEMVSALMKNNETELSEAALLAYRKSLWVGHSAFTRTVFEGALTYVPKREKFESDISENSAEAAKSFALFVSEVRPHLHTMRNILH
jgi:Glycolipid transfer protein (GLTP)